MADAQTKVPIEPHAIELVTALAGKAAAPEIIILDTAGLGDDLPAKIPVAFDRITSSFKSLKGLVQEFRDVRARRKGTAQAETLESFISLIDRHKDAQSALFGKCAWPEPKLTAVLNYNAAEAEVRPADHRIIYAFPLTEEFKAWVSANAKPMEQEVFAAFLEEHAAELAAPTEGEISEYERLFNEKMATPSDVVALSRYLEVFVAARAKQGVRLQSGERTVEFAEEHQNAKGEAITVPGIFMLSVPAFVDGDAVRIPARLRYRVASGKVLWFYQLYRWEFFLREQVESDLEAVAKATGLPAFEGAPEA
ncbi:MAG: DUF2303 family protein [Mesorhizobium sp.]|uniref:DUF2303 family protein n=1 Tax=Mesorhizobium sp. TaxID=1871066 RepID=UPI000FE7011A|nr:DUF2303 family protein [Mesorhizobium sp.]RWQ56538.1 MAG: DUF2303 family protein [Mesorhizobium sp.]